MGNGLLLSWVKMRESIGSVLRPYFFICIFADCA